MVKSILNKTFSLIFSKENRLFLYLICVLIFIAFLSVFANRWNSEQIIDSYKITGNHAIPTEELFQCLDSLGIYSETEKTDLMDLKLNISHHPFVQQAYVMRKNSSDIEIEVEEKSAIAITVNENGDIFYLDQKGELLPYRLSLLYVDLPVIHGLYKKGKLDTRALQDCRNIIDLLYTDENKELKFMISEIIYNQNTKEINLLSTDRAYKIIIGNAQNLSMKFDLLNIIRKNILKNININTVEYVDLRWNNRVIIKNKI